MQPTLNKVLKNAKTLDMFAPVIDDPALNGDSTVVRTGTKAGDTIIAFDNNDLVLGTEFVNIDKI